MQRPDITPAQLVALVGSVLALAVAFGVPISEAQSAAIVDTVQILAPILLAADAVIRHGRSRVAVATEEAKAKAD
jgi:hypothetical protein